MFSPQEQEMNESALTLTVSSSDNNSAYRVLQVETVLWGWVTAEHLPENQEVVGSDPTRCQAQLSSYRAVSLVCDYNKSIADKKTAIFF